ncbi:MAG: hypothetical protein WCT46_06325 [Candidatus Gracilibacteria bacterium]|jgi:hypothetical protein
MVLERGSQLNLDYIGLPGSVKADGLEGAIGGMYDESAQKITDEYNRRLEALEASQDKTSATFASTKKEIIEEHKKALFALRKGFKDIIKGSNAGKEIDDEEDLVNVIRFAMPLLKAMNLGGIVNVGNQERIYTEVREGSEALLGIIEKISKGEGLEVKDYEQIADKLKEFADKNALKVDTANMEQEFAAIRQAPIISLMAYLKPAQRFTLGKTLVDRHGDKGLAMIKELTKVKFFTVMQLDEIAKYAGKPLSNQDRDMCIKAQDMMDQITEQAKVDMKKFYHTTFALKELTYKNVAIWEVGRYLLVATLILNVAVNAKNKDVEGIIMNGPAWASLAGIGFAYNSVTQGGLERALGKKSKAEKKVDEIQQRIDEFRDRFTRFPQRAKWIRDHLKDIHNGFIKTNPTKNKDKKQKIDFKAMGIAFPGEMDGKGQAAIEEGITDMYYDLYFGLGKKSPDPSQDQMAFLDETIRGQTQSTTA